MQKSMISSPVARSTSCGRMPHLGLGRTSSGRRPRTSFSASAKRYLKKYFLGSVMATSRNFGLRRKSVKSRQRMEGASRSMPESVITSYSIHYTKLYERGEKPVIHADGVSRPPPLPDVQKDIHFSPPEHRNNFV